MKKILYILLVYFLSVSPCITTCCLHSLKQFCQSINFWFKKNQQKNKNSQSELEMLHYNSLNKTSQSDSKLKLVISSQSNLRTQRPILLTPILEEDNDPDLSDTSHSSKFSISPKTNQKENNEYIHNHIKYKNTQSSIKNIWEDWENDDHDDSKLLNTRKNDFNEN